MFLDIMACLTLYVSMCFHHEIIEHQFRLYHIYMYMLMFSIYLVWVCWSNILIEMHVDKVCAWSALSPSGNHLNMKIPPVQGFPLSHDCLILITGISIPGKTVFILRLGAVPQLPPFQPYIPEFGLVQLLACLPCLVNAGNWGSL